MRDYKKIVAFQLADELVISVYRVTKNFPKDELFGLTSQFRRAAVSVPANIVEGSRRCSKKDYLHFLYIAQASLSETEYYINLSKKLGYIDEKEFSKLLNKSNETFSKMFGLIEAVRKEI
jgi:four helix bundle protein